MKICCIPIGLICLILSLFFCSNQNISGNGTRIGNPTIAGVLYGPGGKMPACNATVFLRNKDALFNIGNGALQKKFADTAVVKTDNQGRFGFDSVDVGTYVIECTDGADNMALYESVTIENTNYSITLPPDTLKPVGALRGKISMIDGGDYGNVFVLVFGIQRFTTVDASGYFILSDLAEGTYNLRIISGNENYSFLDTSSINVISGDTTNLDNIELPFIGTPEIRNLKVEYDTALQIATVTWNVSDISNVEGFNIYRNNVQGVSGFAKLNTEMLKESVVKDSSIRQGTTYVYRVRVIRKDSTEGPKSPEVSFYAASYFTIDTSYSLCFMNIQDKRELSRKIATDGSELIYTIYQNAVQVYDSNFNFIRSIQDTNLLRPTCIDVTKDGMLCIADAKDNQVKKLDMFLFDAEGNLIKILLLGSDTGRRIGDCLFTINSKDQIILSSAKKDSVYVYDTSGAIIRSWGEFGDGTGVGDNCGISKISTDKNDNIFIYEFLKGIHIYDSTGIFKRFIAIKDLILENPIGTIFSFAVDPLNENLYIQGYTDLYVFDQDGHFIARSQIKASPSRLMFFKNTLYMADASNGRVSKVINNLP